MDQFKKCDFCDVTLKSDIDVIRHLHGDNHIKNKSQFLALMNPQDKVVEKQIPKNFNQMLQLIKVRNVQDLKRINDRNFFKMKDEASAAIGEEIARMLIKTCLRYDAVGTPYERKLEKYFQKEKEKQENMESGPEAQTDSPAEIKRQKAMEAQRKRADEEKRQAEVERQAELERRAEAERLAEEARRGEEQRVKIKIENELENTRQKEDKEKEKARQEANPKQPTLSNDFGRYKIQLAIIKTEPKDD